MAMQERRTLSMMALRQVCVVNEWYTKGTNEEYGKLLRTADALKNVTTEHIVGIAKDILEHSEIDEDLQDIASICYVIAEACTTLFYEVENGK